jgi:hypothetical protein
MILQSKIVLEMFTDVIVQTLPHYFTCPNFIYINGWWQIMILIYIAILKDNFHRTIIERWKFVYLSLRELKM